jgi:hypothetical protein
MHLLWRRYSRSGAAPPIFYAIAGAGFVALAVWAAFKGDWLVVAIALVMIAVTGAGARFMRSHAAQIDAAGSARKDGTHE